MPADRSKRDPASLLPLKPVELLILAMLTAGDRHGYGIREDVLAYTRGAIELEAGNLYRHIRRLEVERIVEEADRRGATSDNERRIYYRLTSFGRRVLAAEILRLRALIQLAEKRRIITPVRA